MTSYLITGATGSFGSHFVKHLLRDSTVKRIVVFSRDELKQSQLAERLGVAHDNPRVRFCLGDVRDPERLRWALEGVETVVHAAALKRVDAGSYNPGEIHKTNVDGTENVCHAAIRAGCARVLFLSSDKAVQPTNIYGASKMLGEHLVTQSNVYGRKFGTRLACVRYGNVLGSRGSVVQLWRDAIAKGVPLSLTDRAMTRYWLTLDDAVRLVEVALTRMAGGEIFVPHLRGMRLVDLLAALVPVGETREVCVTGLRPGGEKLHEALLTPQEAARAVYRDGVACVPPDIHLWTDAAWLGDPLPPEFPLTSDRAVPLRVEEMREMLRSVP